MAKAFDISKFAASLEPAAPAERDIETITAEIIQLKQDAGNAILGIGQRLMEAKAMLPDGEWLLWLSDQVDFSPRTAQRFMRLAKEWTDATALSHLGATKALTLLALPAEEREQFLTEHNVVDMTSRELERAIRERDEAQEAAEAAQAEARTAEESRAKMAADMALLENIHRAAQEGEAQARAALEQAQLELKALREQPVEVAVETVVDAAAVEAARQEAIREMQAKVDKAVAARKIAEEKLKFSETALREAQKTAEANSKVIARAEQAEAELAQVRQQLSAAEKPRTVYEGEELATFKVLFDQAQDTVNKLRGLLLKVRGQGDELAAEKLKRALLALSDAVRRCVE